MRPLQSRRHARARVPPRIHHMFPIMMFRFVQQRLNPGLCETPRSRIQRFFLRPHDRFRIGIHVQILAELRPGEGVELLDTGDGCGV